MRPEYYADEYRRFQTYVRNFGGNRIYRIACGPNSADYRWTEVLMSEARNRMDGLSLHYYTVPGTWQKKGSATDFSEEEWFATLKKAMTMDELIGRHKTIMDRYDPDKRVGLIVDEWGTWFDVEPGTNPGFLYQQNTLRDALVAGLTFHIFHRHCERVHMANIAQTVNVLQAMVLTEGEKMLVTPTYHVFELFKVHQDAEYLPVHLEGKAAYELGGEKLPQLSISATRNDRGQLHISICNLHPREEGNISVELRGMKGRMQVSGRILAGARMNEHNTFDQPERVKPAAFDGASLVNGLLQAAVPPMSVTVLELNEWSE